VVSDHACSKEATKFGEEEYTPLRGHEIGASVMATFLRGRQVYGDGKILGEPAGRYVRRPMAARPQNG
jgi:dihydroorotase-like cyclic amidohydrolase